MRKGMLNGTVFFAVLAAILAGAGCSSSAAARADRPEWALHPPQDSEKIFGIGAASSPNESRGWRMAENRARSSIAYEITAIIESMQIDYTMQAGSDNATVGQEFFQDVGRQMTFNVLNGARVEERGVSGNGVYYVLMSYSESALRSAGNAAIQAATKDAQINAENALRAMDAALASRRAPVMVDSGD